MKPPGRTTPEEFIANHPGATIVMRDKATGLAILAVSPGRVALTVTGTISSEHIVGVLQDANIAERLGSDQFNALIDLSAYTGAVDWKDIQQIKEIMPKGDSHTNKNAYVVRNALYMMVAKITAAFFAHTECAAFLSEKEARAWLGWE